MDWAHPCGLQKKGPKQGGVGPGPQAADAAAVPAGPGPAGPGPGPAGPKKVGAGPDKMAKGPKKVGMAGKGPKKVGVEKAVKKQPVPAARPAGPQAKALYTYEPQAPDELAFSEGAVMDILQKDPSGWWECKRADGVQGWAPGTRAQVWGIAVAHSLNAATYIQEM